MAKRKKEVLDLIWHRSSRFRFTSFPATCHFSPFPFNVYILAACMFSSLVVEWGSIQWVRFSMERLAWLWTLAHIRVKFDTEF